MDVSPNKIKCTFNNTDKSIWPIKAVADIPDSYTLVDNYHDVCELNKRYKTHYDSFFVLIDDGEYIRAYGMYGSIPVMHKPVFEVKI